VISRRRRFVLLAFAAAALLPGSASASPHIRFRIQDDAWLQAGPCSGRGARYRLQLLGSRRFSPRRLAEPLRLVKELAISLLAALAFYVAGRHGAGIALAALSREIAQAPSLGRRVGYVAQFTRFAGKFTDRSDSVKSAGNPGRRE
jgi:hypothetical protein